ncbi:lactonase family protein [Streptomyces viridochromogenes]|uniref:Putative 6-phosphogluconolactonase n=1 Tax=Streptomyces viridochromogenes Tue57 TaxID=1160705 RepID=L8P0M1_STRVR|nr:lactonase family protein [Streptomyces viridochromogenes]ELS51116.1 putative 6-phosphogluconolactonase [Streptomyces viridochromogenes Tue57]
MVSLPVAAAGALHATSAAAQPGSSGVGVSAARKRGRTVAYVGSRTTAAREGRGKGIEVYDVSPAGGDWTLLQTVELDNPTFLAVDRTQRYLYAVHGDFTYVSAYRIAPETRLLTPLGRQETGGRNPVHLAVDPSNRFLVVANHSSGTVATLPLLDDGGVGPVADVLSFPGTPGPHHTEQTGAKPHHVPFSPDGRFIVVPDKGLDRVFAVTLDAESGKLAPGPVPSVAAREMAGPRHIAFHSNLPYAYTIDELRSTVTAYRWDAERGALEALQIVSSTEPSMTGDSRGGEIAVSPDGRFVYASNRSGAGDSTPGGPAPDSIGIFAVSVRTGTLRPVEWTSTAGIRPRFFCFGPDGRRLYAANERSHTIVAFDIDRDSGRLRPTGQVVRTGSPVCVLFVE